MSEASLCSNTCSDDHWRPPVTNRAIYADLIILGGSYLSSILVTLAADAYFVAFNRKTADVAGV